jgi:hypothetical protein
MKALHTYTTLPACACQPYTITIPYQPTTNARPAVRRSLDVEKIKPKRGVENETEREVLYKQNQRRKERKKTCTRA